MTKNRKPTDTAEHAAAMQKPWQQVLREFTAGEVKPCVSPETQRKLRELMLRAPKYEGDD